MQLANSFQLLSNSNKTLSMDFIQLKQLGFGILAVMSMHIEN